MVEPVKLVVGVPFLAQLVHTFGIPYFVLLVLLLLRVKKKKRTADVGYLLGLCVCMCHNQKKVPGEWQA